MDMVGSLSPSLTILLPHCMLLALVAWHLQQISFGPYNTTAPPFLLHGGKLTVHLVSHSHDDVGWLKTVDQYFLGSNNSIQVAAVQHVLDSVVAALQEDPNRKFVFAEQAFFQRWWRRQSPKTQEIVKRLVDSGQLEFINGGYCMHDEAATHYVDMIDQTTLGHRYIKKQFGKTPRIGWQIDPFGHSSVQAYLLGAEVGFDAFFFARADYQDITKRREDRTMEVIWRGSKSLGESAQIFAGLMSHHYMPPREFVFETAVFQDDPLLEGYNVPQRVDLFVDYAHTQSNELLTNHIMWPMGDDFAYENADTWFKQIDKLIHYVNKDGRVNVLYSTPSIYLDAVHASDAIWHLKTKDYFPYSDCPHCFWTGYFTSRPALKGYVRKLSGFLQATRQLEMLLGKKSTGPTTDTLEEALAILQHHDAVSGTEKQHVANDYAMRLAVGSFEAELVFNGALASLLNNMRTNSSETARLKLEQCNLLNVSYCPPTEMDLQSGKKFVVVTYNPLGVVRKDFVRVPISSSKVEVVDADGKSVPSQLIPLTKIDIKLRELYVQLDAGVFAGKPPAFYLVFAAIVPPLGYTSFVVKQASPNSQNVVVKSSFEKPIPFRSVHLTSSQLRLTFSKETGLLTKMTNKKTGVSSFGCLLSQCVRWKLFLNNLTAGIMEVVTAMQRNLPRYPWEGSGAYIFRPSTSECFSFENPKQSVTVFRGPLVEEVHQQVSPWVSQVVRMYHNAAQVEVQFTIGPIPIEDNYGKELVTRLTTSLQTNSTFYTDSNGRDFLKRVRDYRPDWVLDLKEPIAGNYYPLNLGIYMKDVNTDVSVLVDRALGGASIYDGQLEIMLHRRLLSDDGRGVGEALNEIVCSNGGQCEGLTVQGSLYININPAEEAAQWRRIKGQHILMPLQLAFSVLEDGNAGVLHSPQFSAFKSGYELPPNVAIVTLQELDNGQVLLRLANIFEVEESEKLSKMATVNLSKIFRDKKVEGIVEVSLSANQEKSVMRKLKWRIEGDQDNPRVLRGGPLTKNDPNIEIAPMEIRTFLINFETASHWTGK